MQHLREPLETRTALITGGARRIGAEIARGLHKAGINVVIHYRSSIDEAIALQQELNTARNESAHLLQADLLVLDTLQGLCEKAHGVWGRLDILINNASAFYPTPVADATESDWNEIVGINLKVPFFLAQCATPYLREVRGTIINIVDIHAERPLKDYVLYSTAKAGLIMLTKALAKELAPDVRVNGISPGAFLWPDSMSKAAKQQILSRTLLKRKGQPSELVGAVLFLIRDADYMTGQVITIDGGQMLAP
ncbi:MAG: pteridine reductase [Gammaproteobacteria bacterium]|nr:pteridine reductase [Gammaproteobacteria bacterium]